MSQHDHTPVHSSASTTDKNPDGTADVLATIVLITLVVGAVVFWLKSFAS